MSSGLRVWFITEMLKVTFLHLGLSNFLAQKM